MSTPCPTIASSAMPPSHTHTHTHTLHIITSTFQAPASPTLHSPCPPPWVPGQQCGRPGLAPLLSVLVAAARQAMYDRLTITTSRTTPYPLTVLTSLLCTTSHHIRMVDVCLRARRFSSAQYVATIWPSATTVYSHVLLASSRHFSPGRHHCYFLAIYQPCMFSNH